MKVFVTGGCGYKGTVLVPKLLERGHQVVAFDIQWFGNRLRPHPSLTVIKGDVRNPEEYDLSGLAWPSSFTSTAWSWKWR